MASSYRPIELPKNWHKVFENDKHITFRLVINGKPTSNMVSTYIPNLIEPSKYKVIAEMNETIRATTVARVIHYARLMTRNKYKQ